MSFPVRLIITMLVGFAVGAFVMLIYILIGGVPLT